MSRHDTAVADYCRRYKASGLSEILFAMREIVRDRDLCLAVLEVIGSWPSSEPELRALQQAYR